MGCCQNRELTSEDHIELTISKTQYLIGFSNIRLCDISNILDTLLHFEKIDQQTFEKICKKLKINLKNPIIRDFYLSRYQTDINIVNRRKLVTLIALMCIGSREEKAKIIFKNYIEKDQEFITKNDVKLMIEEICEIFIKDIINISKSFHPSYLSMAEYEMQFLSGFNFLVNYYLEQIFEDASDSRMVFVSFLRKMSFNTVSPLLSPSDLRKNSFMLLKFVKKAQFYAKGMIDNMNSKEDKNMSYR